MSWDPVGNATNSTSCKISGAPSASSWPPTHRHRFIASSPQLELMETKWSSRDQAGGDSVNRAFGSHRFCASHLLLRLCSWRSTQFVVVCRFCFLSFLTDKII